MLSLWFILAFFQFLTDPNKWSKSKVVEWQLSLSLIFPSWAKDKFQHLEAIDDGHLCTKRIKKALGGKKKKPATMTDE